jgi:hypothetical protein
VFVTGTTELTEYGYSHYATIAYSGTGVPLWTNLYHGAGPGNDVPSGLAVDNNGNVFVTGTSTGLGTAYDYATVAYSGTGLPLWTNRYNGPSGNWESARAIAVDRDGNVLVTGYATGTSDDYVTIKYSGAGVALWTNRYDGPANSYDDATALAIDGNGTVFVTGSSSRASSDYVTIAYSSAGIPLWTNRYNGPANGGDKAVAVAVDDAGNVVVTGVSTGTGSFYDYATIAYSGTGVPLWTNRYSGPTRMDDAPQTKSCLAIGPDGSVYVTGASDGGYFATAFDYLTIKYMPASLVPALLNIERRESQVVLSWDNPLYRLQSAPAAAGSFIDIFGATSPHTNLISENQKFFRLKRN